MIAVFSEKFAKLESNVLANQAKILPLCLCLLAVKRNVMYSRVGGNYQKSAFSGTPQIVKVKKSKDRLRDCHRLEVTAKT